MHIICYCQRFWSSHSCTCAKRWEAGWGLCWRACWQPATLNWWICFLQRGKPSKPSDAAASLVNPVSTNGFRKEGGRVLSVTRTRGNKLIIFFKLSIAANLWLNTLQVTAFSSVSPTCYTKRWTIYPKSNSTSLSPSLDVCNFNHQASENPLCIYLF